MQFGRLPNMGAVVFLAGLTLFSGLAAAKDGRDFNGEDSLSNVAEHDGQVDVMLTLHLFNRTGDALQQAVVVVRPSRPGPGVLATLDPIPRWAAGRDVVLSRHLTISTAEFERWNSRAQPGLYVRYATGGQEWQRPVQLSRRPVVAVVKPLAEAAGSLDK